MLRDLLPVIVLPTFALGLAIARLRRSPEGKSSVAARVLEAGVTLSLCVALGYAVLENLAEASP